MSFRTSSSERTVRDAAAGIEQQGGFVVKSATSGLVYGVIRSACSGVYGVAGERCRFANPQRRRDECCGS